MHSIPTSQYSGWEQAYDVQLFAYQQILWTTKLMMILILLNYV